MLLSCSDRSTLSSLRSVKASVKRSDTMTSMLSALATIEPNLSFDFSSVLWASRSSPKAFIEATGVFMSWDSWEISSILLLCASYSFCLASFNSDLMMSKLSVKLPKMFPLSISNGFSRLPDATSAAKSLSLPKGLTMFM